MSLQMALFRSFLWLSNISVCICIYCTSVSVPLLMDTSVASSPGYCKQYCSERWGACICSVMLFTEKGIQEWTRLEANNEFSYRYTEFLPTGATQQQQQQITCIGRISCFGYCSKPFTSTNPLSLQPLCEESIISPILQMRKLDSEWLSHTADIGWYRFWNSELPDLAITPQRLRPPWGLSGKAPTC